jgi:hypothetical protein
MHDMVMAYPRLTHQGEGEEPEVGKASEPKLDCERLYERSTVHTTQPPARTLATLFRR